MAVTQGRLTTVGIGKESTFGTAVSRTNWLKVDTITGLTEVQSIEPIPHLRHGGSTNPAFVDYHAGDVALEGSMGGPLLYDGCGLLIQTAFGAAVSSSGAGPYTHTYNLGTNVDSLTLEIIRGTSGNSEILVGCCIRTFSIIIEQGKYARWEADFICQKANADRSSAGTPSFTAFNGANLVGNSIKGHQAAALSGTSAAYAIHSRITYSLDRKLTGIRALGSKYIAEVVAGDYASLSVQVDRMDNGDALYNGHRAVTQSDLTQAITGTGNLAGTFTARNAVISNDSADIPNAGPIVERVVFMPFSDDTDNALTIAITNDSSSGTAN